MTRQISAEGLAHVKRWEGLRLDSYRDVAGVWTIGYGHTGSPAAPGVSITEAEAEVLLRSDLSTAETAVAQMVKVPLSDEQHAALVSFVFNVGVTAFAKSTLLKVLNDGAYDEVPAQLQRWVFAGGKRTPGLVNRRAAEAGLWAKGAYVNSASVEAVTPPADLKKSRTIWAAGLGGVSLAIPAILEGWPTISAAFTDSTTQMAPALGGNAVWAGYIGAALALARIVWARIDDANKGSRP